MHNTEIFEVRGLNLGRASATEQLVDFALRGGQWCLLTGKNGSGKTTLLRMLCGLSAPHQGAVQWQGVPITDDRTTYHRAFIYIGHKFGFRGGLSIAENLAFYRAIRAHREGDIGAAMNYFKVDDLATRPYVTLSHGQQQRAVLCRLIVEKVRLWLLDEPTSALDRQGHDIFQDLLLKHLATGGMAVVATHKPFAHKALPAAYQLQLNDWI